MLEASRPSTLHFSAREPDEVANEPLQSGMGSQPFRFIADSTGKGGGGSVAEMEND